MAMGIFISSNLVLPLCFEVEATQRPGLIAMDGTEVFSYCASRAFSLASPAYLLGFNHAAPSQNIVSYGALVTGVKRTVFYRGIKALGTWLDILTPLRQWPR